MYARYVAGQKSSEGVDLEGLFARITDGIDAAWEFTTDLRR